ncbi:unnamed protein product [Euphydryas editha]|uniref:FP protein C-terminal domain-containing protein n=1 Tax=Euphydryas editha TaxID=104508 RepID=A0AAU9TRI7_EUPED|nr:unnamed protein product [Euphydryas editha]
MANNSQILLDIFQEIFAASGNSSDSKVINETRILSALKEQAAKANPENFGSVLIKVVSDVQSKLNLTRKPNGYCHYCDGDFRDVIQAYNGIHGYVSLIENSRFINCNAIAIVVGTSSAMVKSDILRLSKAFNIKTKGKLCAKHLGFLTSEDTPIFICEQLTTKGARLYYLARDLAKSAQYKFCWTAYGKVYVRKTETSQVVCIKSEAQVHQLLIKE